jgi:hypothetical protein
VQPQLQSESLGVLFRRNLGWLLAGLAIALAAAYLSGRSTSEFAAATTQVMVDFPGQSALLETNRPVGPLAERANVYARLAASPAIRALIGREAGIDPSQIDAMGPYNPDAQRIQREPTAERRASQLRGESKQYRLRFDSEQAEAVPIVLAYAQAPTVGEATKLADAGATALIEYVRQVQRTEGLKDSERLQLRQLGEPEGGIVNPGADRQVAIIAFMAAFLGWTVLVLMLSTLRRLLSGRARPPVAGVVAHGEDGGPPVPLKLGVLDSNERGLADRFAGWGR